ncbi:hypothetical protein EIK77_002866 [Talaromyces pinophilus]|nr:hypothetical protein EIK77_002866 [Talaromyces pinophilus]
MENSPGASKAFLMVIQASSILVLDEILDDEGIVRIPDSDLATFEQAEEGGNSLGEDGHADIPAERFDRPSHEESLPEVQADIGNHAYTPSTSEEVHSVTSHSRSSTPYIAVHRTEHVHRHNSFGIQDVPPEPPLAEPSHYVRVLEKVIQIAQRTNIPFRSDQPGNSAVTTGGLTSEEHTSAFGSRSQNQFAHDIKIGAAGELFVSFIPTSTT